MSGYTSGRMRWDCHRDGCLQSTLPTWDWMEGCFPRRIMPTDVDGMVEINRCHLFLEQKSHPRACVPGGQRSALLSLSSKPNTTVCIFRPTDVRDVYERMLYVDGESTGFEAFTRGQLQNFFRSWSASADNHGRWSA